LNHTATKPNKSQCELDAVHAIKRIRHYTQASTKHFHFKCTLLLVLELACYLITAYLIYFVIQMNRRLPEMESEVLRDYKFFLDRMIAGISLVTFLIALLLRNIIYSGK
jgi:hypothetical protein